MAAPCTCASWSPSSNEKSRYVVLRRAKNGGVCALLCSVDQSLCEPAARMCDLGCTDRVVKRSILWRN